MAFILTKDHSTSNYGRLKRGCDLNQSIGNFMRQNSCKFSALLLDECELSRHITAVVAGLSFRLFSVVPRYTVRD
jgi:hypothetical protein